LADERIKQFQTQSSPSGSSDAVFFLFNSDKGRSVERAGEIRGENLEPSNSASTIGTRGRGNRIAKIAAMHLVRFWSSADIATDGLNIRFAPESGH
jgi:hypothetical protein